MYAFEQICRMHWIRYKASANCTQVVVTGAYIMTRQDLLLITTAASLALTVFDVTSHVYLFFSLKFNFFILFYFLNCNLAAFGLCTSAVRTVS